MPFGFSFEKKQIADFLANAKFPASKKQLLDQAFAKDVPSAVLTMLQALPERTFENAEDVNKGMARHAA